MTSVGGIGMRVYGFSWQSTEIKQNVYVWYFVKSVYLVYLLNLSVQMLRVVWSKLVRHQEPTSESEEVNQTDHAALLVFHLLLISELWAKKQDVHTSHYSPFDHSHGNLIQLIHFQFSTDTKVFRYASSHLCSVHLSLQMF